jgi:hypothetical protein
VLKMLEKYKYLSSEWFLFGKGTMYKDVKMQTLFDDTDGSDINHRGIDSENKMKSNISEYQQINVQKMPPEPESYSKNKTLRVEKIVWFYSDNSFQEYIPAKD